MCAASRTGSTRSPVTAQRRRYASVTMTRKLPCPRRGWTRIGSPYRGGGGATTDLAGEVLTLRCRERIALSSDDVPLPPGHPQPLMLREEEGLFDQHASDRVLLASGQIQCPQLGLIPSQAGDHLAEAADTVLFPEGVPCQAERQHGVVREDAAPDDRILRVVELEEEEPARSQRSKRRRAGTPEVDLVQRRYRTEVVVPPAVGNADEDVAHAGSPCPAKEPITLFQECHQRSQRDSLQRARPFGTTGLP